MSLVRKAIADPEAENIGRGLRSCCTCRGLFEISEAEYSENTISLMLSYRLHTLVNYTRTCPTLTDMALIIIPKVPWLKNDNEEVDELNSESSTHDDSVSDENDASASESEGDSSDSLFELDPDLQVSIFCQVEHTRTVVSMNLVQIEWKQNIVNFPSSRSALLLWVATESGMSLKRRRTLRRLKHRIQFASQRRRSRAWFSVATRLRCLCVSERSRRLSCRAVVEIGWSWYGANHSPISLRKTLGSSRSNCRMSSIITLDNSLGHPTTSLGWLTHPWTS